MTGAFLRMAYITRFLATEAGSGVVLLTAAVAAVIAANSEFADHYTALLAYELRIGVEGAALIKTLLHWINDGLMALFFLLVGIEIRREMVDGELRRWNQAALPVIGAVGGVAVPALIYAAFNAGSEAIRGWAIPSATDIAFSLGVLALFGSRVPLSLKVFLMTLAVIDDMAAVLIIAFFYTAQLAWIPVLGACLVVGILAVMSRKGVQSVFFYLLFGMMLWLLVLKSGVHATIAGVMLGLLIPVHGGCAHRLEKVLHPLVAYGIMPLFAFANAGVSLQGIRAEAFLQPVTCGILVGLVVGKPVGICASVWLAMRFLRARALASWPAVIGVGALAGIGFTMSLFIGGLAFPDAEMQQEVKLGVLAGSLTSALLGALILWRVTAPSADVFQSEHSRHDDR